MVHNVKELLYLQYLESLPRWVSWRTVDGRKIPFRPDGRGKASATESRTWGTRAQAAACQPVVDAPCGVGIVLGPVPELGRTILAGIDLDACRDPESGWLTSEAHAVIERFSSYTEISPSKRGVKILFLIAAADLPAVERLTGGKARCQFPRGQHDEIALDVHSRYYAITDDTIQWRDEINFVPVETIRWLIEEAGPEFVKGRGADKPRDNSRSGRAFRLAQQIRRDGGSLLDFEEALADDSELRLWAKDARQVLRAWRRSSPGSDVVERLNQRFALVRHEGRTLIAQGRGGGFDLGSVEHFHSYLANDRIEADDKKIPASLLWLQSPKRRTFESLVFDPSGRASDDALNLWRGFAVAPDSSAACKLILQHIQEIICAGNERLNRYVLGWLAHLVQRPAEKPGVAVVLRGGKGAGKDTLAQALRPILGRHYAHSDKSDALTAKFNSDLATALLIHVEEAFWAGDRSKLGTLQSLITAPTMRLEKKGVDAFTVDSFCRVLMTTNNDWAIPASHDERRYCVLDVSDSRIGEIETYFKPLYSEIEGNGPAAFLNYLQAYDLTGVDVRTAPKTSALVDQKVETLRGIQKWWHGLLAAGSLPTQPFDDGEWRTEAATVDRDAMRGSYDAWLRDNRYEGRSLDATRFGLRLREMVALETRRGSRQVGRPYFYALPSLADCREQFESWIGGDLRWE